jgi:hypothetical protein
VSDTEGTYTYESVHLSRGGFGGYEVDPEALRDYASRLEAFRDRFMALAEASQSTAQTAGAFGTFSAWMEPILDEKHALVHELIPVDAEVLESYIAALNGCADEYEAADASAAGELSTLEGEF